MRCPIDCRIVVRQARYERTECFIDDEVDVRALEKCHVVAALPMDIYCGSPARPKARVGSFLRLEFRVNIFDERFTDVRSHVFSNDVVDE